MNGFILVFFLISSFFPSIMNSTSQEYFSFSAGFCYWRYADFCSNGYRRLFDGFQRKIFGRVFFLNFYRVGNEGDCRPSWCGKSTSIIKKCKTRSFWYQCIFIVQPNFGAKLIIDFLLLSYLADHILCFYVGLDCISRASFGFLMWCIISTIMLSSLIDIIDKIIFRRKKSNEVISRRFTNPPNKFPYVKQFMCDIIQFNGKNRECNNMPKKCLQILLGVSLSKTIVIFYKPPR